RVGQRYELLEQLSERKGVFRYKARDLGLDGTDNTPVIVLKEAAPQQEQPIQAEPVEAIPVEAVDTTPYEELLPIFDEISTAVPGAPVTGVMPQQLVWPSAGWERNLLDTIAQPGLPVVLDSFIEDGYQYVIEQVPAG